MNSGTRGSGSMAARIRDRRPESVRYDRRHGRVEIVFQGGALFAFPAELAQGLRGASARDLADVRLSPGGTAVHWERLDVDLAIAGLVAGVYGTREWMRELGRRGGSVSSPGKAAAARANGLKGGRPRTAKERQA
ncbi:MAG: DUF2442 domain-containing protein [Gemmatimonadetes bacterium]|nr:DUF2442 domain-containing protein [Gemmatimonadota bacterium]